MTFQKLTTMKNFKNGFQKKGRKMKKEDRQIIWKAKKNKVTALMSYYGFYNGKELFVIQEDIMFHLIGMDIPSDIPYIDSFFTLKSAKHGAERFLKRLQETRNRKEEIMKKVDRQIIWKLDWLCYAGFYKEYKIFECFEWEKSQWEVNLILGNFKTKIGTYTTCRSAKRGAERFLKKLQKQLSEK